MPRSMPSPLLRVPLLLAGGALALFSASRASAAGPTTEECLAASDASLRSGTEHKLRDERAQLVICAAASCPEPIRKECLSHVDEVNAQIPTLIVAAKDASGADLTAVRVAMDGEPLTDALNGTAFAVDPGQHVFTFDAAGQTRVTRTLLIQQAQKDRRELVTFGPSPASGAAPAPSATPGAAGQPSTGGGLGTQRVVALVAGGAGVVALGVGAAFGAIALSEKSTAQAACAGSTCATPDGVSKWSSAASSGNVSTVGLIVGGVGMAAGAVLWFTAPRKSAGASAQVGLGPGVVQLRGTW